MKATFWLLMALLFGFWGLVFAIDPHYGGKWWVALGPLSVAGWALGLCIQSCEAFIKRRGSRQN